MKKIIKILLLFTILCACTLKALKKHHHNKTTKQEAALKEKVSLLLEVQEELKNDLKTINEKIKKDYQSLHSIAEKLKKLELTHQTALEFEQLVTKMNKKLMEKGKKNDNKVKELNEAHQYAETAIREIEKAYSWYPEYGSLS